MHEKSRIYTNPLSIEPKCSAVKVHGDTRGQNTNHHPPADPKQPMHHHHHRVHQESIVGPVKLNNNTKGKKKDETEMERAATSRHGEEVTTSA